MTTTVIEGKITLQELPGEIRSCWSARGGKERQPDGSFWPFDLLRTEAKIAPRRKASRGTVIDMLEVDRVWRERGHGGLRVTDPWRDPAIQAASRELWENWKRAGSPAPGTAGFNAKLMKAAFVAPMNESGHPWGGAIDVDVHAMCDDRDDRLAEFWDVAKLYGFTPIISEPHVDQSEAWHFDHFGALAAVRELYRGSKWRGIAYPMTATCGCLFAGTFMGNRLMERLVQARLVFAYAVSKAFKPDPLLCLGPIDGDIGPATRRIADALELGIAKQAPASEYLNALNKRRLGLDEIASL